MGSKTPQHEYQRHNDAPPIGNTSGNPTDKRSRHSTTDGDGCMGSNGGGDGSDDDDDDDALVATAPAAVVDDPPNSSENKKRKKRSKKSKKKQSTASKQTSPPTIPISQLYPSAVYPTGQLLEYVPLIDISKRTAAAELRATTRPDLSNPDFLNTYRHAAEVHRQTRAWAASFAKPGTSLTDLANGIDAGVRALLSNDGLAPGAGLQSGLGFPPGFSVNDVVAHYTPNPGFKDVLISEGDVLKIDFGVHIGGWIVDSAFTMSWDPVYDELLAAPKAATEAGIKLAGPDARIASLSAAIQETMESYEVTLPVDPKDKSKIGSKTYPVKAVRNITGHNIQHYRIHGGKSIPFVKFDDDDEDEGGKMEEGEVYAVETFGTTGRGWLRDGDGVYGYGLPYTANLAPRTNLPLTSANKLYRTIKDNFGTLVFCRRQLAHLGCERYLAGLHSLVSHGILDEYRPLVDVKGSYSAQFEHTILLRENCKEVVSRGDDY